MEDQQYAIHGGQFFDDIGADFSDLSRRTDVINADVLDAWYPPSPLVLSAITEHLEWLIRTSPPTRGEGLIRAIARTRGIKSECIAIGPGSSQLIYSVLPFLISGGDRAVLLDPTYGEYAHVIENCIGATIDRLALNPLLNFVPSIGALAELAQGASLVVLVNPNSPTGNYVEQPQIRELLELLDPATHLLVDEAYVDFVGEDESVESWVDAYPNLVAIKSLSKYYALSGMRVGYVAAHPRIIEQLQPFSAPWPSGLLAQVAAVRALSDKSYYRKMASRTEELRNKMFADLGTISTLKVFPSRGNFLLVEILDEEMSSELLVSRLRDLKIHIRDCRSCGEQMGDRFVRIALKDDATNERIADAIRRCIVP